VPVETRTGPIQTRLPATAPRRKAIRLRTMRLARMSFSGDAQWKRHSSEIGRSMNCKLVIRPRWYGSSDDIDLFAAVSGDVNPDHLDATFAATDLFGHIVAHGMWTGALVSACSVPSCPDQAQFISNKA
jgi:MaoC like domain